MVTFLLLFILICSAAVSLKETSLLLEAQQASLRYYQSLIGNETPLQDSIKDSFHLLFELVDLSSHTSHGQVISAFDAMVSANRALHEWLLHRPDHVHSSRQVKSFLSVAPVRVECNNNNNNNSL